MQDIYKRLIKELFKYQRLTWFWQLKKTILRYMLAVFKYKNNEQLVREKRSKKHWKKSAKSFVC